jgi:hypothetical protein
MRYLVASHRYAITKEMREILVLHFEDAFQSFEAVDESDSRLQAVAARTSATVETLLRANENAGGVGAAGDQVHRDFARMWTLQPDPTDRDVVDFSAWAALLLHLMTHKAYCVLYHPLFRDPAMVANNSVRTK